MKVSFGYKAIKQRVIKQFLVFLLCMSILLALVVAGEFVSRVLLDDFVQSESGVKTFETVFRICAAFENYNREWAREKADRYSGFLIDYATLTHFYETDDYYYRFGVLANSWCRIGTQKPDSRYLTVNLRQHGFYYTFNYIPVFQLDMHYDDVIVIRPIYRILDMVIIGKGVAFSEFEWD